MKLSFLTKIDVENIYFIAILSSNLSALAYLFYNLRHKMLENNLIDNKVNKVLAEIALIEAETTNKQTMNFNMMDYLNNIFNNVVANDLGPSNVTEKTAHSESGNLVYLDNGRLLKLLRISRSQFIRILDLIKYDVALTIPSSNLLLPVDHQLAIVLLRLGLSGHVVTKENIAYAFGVSVNTASLITKRVFRAILRQMDKFIYWPNAEQRGELVAETYHELPFCIGYIGSTEIKLALEPKLNEEIYFSRQRMHSIKLQIVCDHQLRIRNAVVGNPGSYNNSKIYLNCQLHKKSNIFFSGSQWIAGDCSYPLVNTLVTPYTNGLKHKITEGQERFNRRHSQYHVKIENCFKLLKHKFASLKEMYIQIKDKGSQTFLCKWVLVCCLLYNVLLEEKLLKQTESMAKNHVAKSTYVHSAGAEKRRHIYNKMFKE